MDLWWVPLIGGIAAAAAFLYKAILGDWNLKRYLEDRRARSNDTTPPPALDIPEYRRRVKLSHSRLRFGDPTSAAANNPAEPGMPLTSMYTPLFVATEFGLLEHLHARPVQLRIPVEEALYSPEAMRCVILGDPGAGKSTLVDYLVATLADDAEQLPVHVRLSEIASPSTDSLWVGVVEAHDQGLPYEPLCTELRAAMRNGKAFVFLDGLDEVPSEAVPRAISLITSLALEFPDARIAVTCRSHDYYMEHPNRQLPSNFGKWRLLPFSLDDMLSYVDRWYDALRELKFVGSHLERKRNLQDSLRNQADLEDLGSTPLLLTIMALVHTTEGELPSARSLLYYKAVAHLLADNPQWRAKYVQESVNTEEMISIATEIAFKLQEDRTAGRENESIGDGFVGLSLEEIESVVKEELVRRRYDPNDYKSFRLAVDVRVNRIVQSNGLLLEQRAGHFEFAHRSLKEFLAGMYILNGADYTQFLQLAKMPTWREPLVLVSGYGSNEAHALYFLTSYIRDLAGDPETRTLAGEMLAEIGKDTLRRKRYGSVIDGPQSLWWTIVDRLFEGLAEVTEIPERIHCLQVLGRLGDPRFVTRDDAIVSQLSDLVDLPAIAITIGDDGRDRPRAKSELVATAPLRTIEVERLKVSRYLVTNVEYRQFINHGGYDEMRWWTEEGQRWMRGERDFAEELEARTVEWIHRDFGAELERGKFRIEDVLRDAAAMSKPRTEPFYWRNSRYNQENQPVVGINWWEANAYCEWLTSHRASDEGLPMKARVALPNEWEWERFARSVNDRRAFPWGSNENTALRAHTRFDGLDLDAATPVGAYPLGNTVDGLCDVAGNVWEWTSSRALPMSVHFDRDRHTVQGVTDVVVRGGSWFSDVDGAVRCGYRGIDLPQNVYYDVGMRVIVREGRDHDE